MNEDLSALVQIVHEWLSMPWEPLSYLTSRSLCACALKQRPRLVSFTNAVHSPWADLWMCQSSQCWDFRAHHLQTGIFISADLERKSFFFDVFLFTQSSNRDCQAIMCCFTCCAMKCCFNRALWRSHLYSFSVSECGIWFWKDDISLMLYTYVMTKENCSRATIKMLELFRWAR